MEFKDRTIGIWGFGVVGTAAVNFLGSCGARLQLMDQKKPDAAGRALLEQYKVDFILQNEKSISRFLRDNELILPSPGINVRSHVQDQSKIISEVDVFGALFKKPVIAITGTIGKTSITTLLSEMLRAAGKKVVTGGNIGIPLFDLIAHQEEADLAVVELSSFQLSCTTSFAPDLAVWTNFFPNHLDWHGSIQDYLQAKTNIIRYQKKGQHALIPLELHTRIMQEQSESKLHLFTFDSDDHEYVPLEPCYRLTTDTIVFSHKKTKKTIATISSLPKISYVQNWLIIYAILDILQVKVPAVFPSFSLQKGQLEHRLEFVATVNGVDFYNDSKATVAQATLAALQTLAHRSIILLLGGLSKGVNRKELIDQLPAHIKLVICFGKESYQLHKMCASVVPTASFATLELAYKHAVKKAQPGDVVLLSPGGSSLDLFTNYQERGRRFKQLVRES